MLLSKEREDSLVYLDRMGYLANLALLDHLDHVATKDLKVTLVLLDLLERRVTGCRL